MKQKYHLQRGVNNINTKPCSLVPKALLLPIRTFKRGYFALVKGAQKLSAKISVKKEDKSIP